MSTGSLDLFPFSVYLNTFHLYSVTSPSPTVSSHECSASLALSMPFCELENFTNPLITFVSYFCMSRMTALAIVTTKTPSH